MADDAAANNAGLLRDAVTRIPIWTGEGTDLFTPDQWLARVEKARQATNWNDEQTMSFIYVSLRGEALEWYDCLQRSGIVLNYAGFIAAFRTSYASSLTARSATVKLHEVKQGTNERIVAYYARVLKIVTNLETLLPQAQRRPAGELAFPAEIVALAGFNALAAGIRNDTIPDTIDKGITIAMNHVGMQLFVAGMKPIYRDKMMENMPNSLWEAFQEGLRFEKIHGPLANSVSLAVNEIGFLTGEQHEEQIEAVQAQLKRLQTRREQFYQRRPDARPTNKKDSGKSNKDIICRCCNKFGHMQDVCFTRIRKNLPCVDANGVPLKTQPPKKPNQGRVNEIAQGENAQNGSKTPPSPPQQHNGANGFAPPNDGNGYWTPYLPNFP